MDFRETIKVNGVPVRLQPYSELRHKMLRKVDKEVNEFVYANKQKKFSEVPRSKKADFWFKRAQVLWEPDPELDEDGLPKGLSEAQWDRKKQFFTKAFFEDEGFEYNLLQKSKFFFLNQEFFL